MSDVNFIGYIMLAAPPLLLIAFLLDAAVRDLGCRPVLMFLLAGFAVALWLIVGASLGRNGRVGMTALRDWLWINFGWDIYDWDEDDIRF